MAQIHKYCPWMKHLDVKLHHFRLYVNDGFIKLQKIGTDEQQADYLTKPLVHHKLVCLRKLVNSYIFTGIQESQ